MALWQAIVLNVLSKIVPFDTKMKDVEPGEFKAPYTPDPHPPSADSDHQQHEPNSTPNADASNSTPVTGPPSAPSAPGPHSIDPPQAPASPNSTPNADPSK